MFSRNKCCSPKKSCGCGGEVIVEEVHGDQDQVPVPVPVDKNDPSAYSPVASPLLPIVSIR
ncbi:MAG: hypothetical protein MPJ24_11975 [Pirellulaceae bacterium]|nr:hypothetical protein [Pirellulaceae bacterium]